MPAALRAECWPTMPCALSRGSRRSSRPSLISNECHRRIHTLERESVHRCAQASARLFVPEWLRWSPANVSVPSTLDLRTIVAGKGISVELPPHLAHFLSRDYARQNARAHCHTKVDLPWRLRVTPLARRPGRAMCLCWLPGIRSCLVLLEHSLGLSWVSFKHPLWSLLFWLSECPKSGSPLVLDFLVRV